MIDFNTTSIDELEVISICLDNIRRDLADLDLPILEGIIDQVTAELEKRK